MVRDGWIMVVPLAGMSIICVVINFFSPGVIWVFLATVIAFAFIDLLKNYGNKNIANIVILCHSFGKIEQTFDLER